MRDDGAGTDDRARLDNGTSSDDGTIGLSDGAGLNGRVAPFWPRRSPHFLQVRTALRGAVQRWRDKHGGNKHWADKHATDERWADEHGGAEFVIAVSGGPDSLALAAAAAAEKLPAHVVSIDHGLQDGSRAVSEGAIGQVGQWGLSGQVVSVRVVGEPLEAAARHARYQALGDLAGRRPILLAHTGDDQAETLLLGLLRGKASAMGEVSDYQGHTLLRPLLGIRRAHTVGACRELGVAAWNDPHNTDEAFRRVAIRRQVLPLLDQIIGGDATAPLVRAAELLREDDDYLHTLTPKPERSAAATELITEPATQPATEPATQPATEQYTEPVTQQPPALEIAELGPPPLARRAIAKFLQQHGARVSASTLAASIAFIHDWHGQGAVSVGNGLELARQAGKLVLLHSSLGDDSQPSASST
ncbi:tRNA lysidine(34) synthetase TilS [Corynebacterium pseudodiphtheriticum]|uniref:tRNA lysidine(34) synthetase TilS n=1 Tax=Corynebacterium pseudodiphtheriticum TaxID=37637 RepID=UPI00254C4A57|nr:tRNA lysidine(34) synthetase TilS [Corynebacterium pseudodiphtheriticum]MDK8487256.1 tRNA lysidine(34) synthetase TilS [Corynebacterium pseudodiphtheriticum]MDK8494564.1 tRNA lysidine(34) synthetase TilS [Corynebacterium pseudodiphtheriticum]